MNNSTLNQVSIDISNKTNLDFQKQISKDYNFQNLLQSISVDDFVSKYWDQSVFVLERHDESYFKDLMCLKDVDQFLSTRNVDGELVSLINNSGSKNSENFITPDGRINLNKIYAYYEEGYSLKRSRMHLDWEPVKKLCKNLREAFSHNVKANMVLTPKNSSAFKTCTETHDVIILQLEGEKCWELFDSPIETPMLNSPELILEKNDLRSLKNVTLKAGDLMYIPRGVARNSFTLNRSSLHLEIGIYPIQMIDLLKDSLTEIALSDARLRKSLPLGYLNNFKEISKIQFLLKEIASESILKLDSSNSLNAYKNLMKIVQKPNSDGHFESLDKIDLLNLNSELKIRENMNVQLAKINENYLRLIFDGNTLKGPTRIRKAFEFFVQSKFNFRPLELPQLSDKDKLILCKRLVKSGLLQVVSL